MATIVLSVLFSYRKNHQHITLWCVMKGEMFQSDFIVIMECMHSISYCPLAIERHLSTLASCYISVVLLAH